MKTESKVLIGEGAVFVSRTIAGSNGLSRAGVHLARVFSEQFKELVILRSNRSKFDLSANARDITGLRSRNDRYLSLLPFGKRVVARLLSYLQWKRLRSALSDRQVELVVINGYDSWELYCTLRTELRFENKVKVLFIVHEAPGHFKDSRDMTLAQAISVLTEVDAAIFVAEVVRKEWCALVGHEMPFSVAIPNTVEEKEIEVILTQDRGSIRKELGIATNEIVAMCVGNVIPRKGQDRIVREMPSLFSEYDNFYVWMVGGDEGKFAEQLKIEVATGELKSKVRFIGRRNDARCYIYACDMLLVPSRVEAMPLTILEAMALGCPAVASAVNGVPEIVTHGQSGLMFDDEKKGDLEAKVSTMLLSKSERDRLGRGAQQRYRDHFTYRAFSLRYRDAVQGIIGGAVARVPSRKV